ncbi:MAG: GNAT family N-acetyltransferase [Fimbriimonas sp.]
MLMRFHLVEAGDEAALADVRTLFEAYQRELGIDLCFQGFQEELASLPGAYAAPRGRLYLIYDAGRAVACGALRPLKEEGTAEIKRMYVLPERKGEGIGRNLLLMLMKAAEMEGYARVRLDTLARLEPAVRLYESVGFRRIEPYNENPEADVLYFERET